MTHTIAIDTPPVTGPTTYVMAEAAGLGATLDRALDEAAGHRVTRVIVCGELPTGRAMHRWVAELGGWVHEVEPYVGTVALRARCGRDGHTISVSRAAQWFGTVTPAAAAEATKHVRHVIGMTGATMVGSPSHTGLAMLHKLWERRGVEYPVQPIEVQTLLRATSGQGRFELLDRGRARGGRRLISVDARFAYAALAKVELPVGEPVELLGVEPDEYAPSWCEVEAEVDGGYNAPLPFGLLPVMREGGRREWHYPAAGRFVTWCSGAEVQLARRHGYRVSVRRAIVWPGRARPLASWAQHLIRERDRMMALPIDEATREAVRAACRGIVLHTIGMLHGRDTIEQHTVSDPAAIPLDATGMRPVPGGWQYEARRPNVARAGDSHPEWTATLWALGRARLASHMIEQPPGAVVAVALDSMMLDREPIGCVDTGAAGSWRETKRAGSWQPFTSMFDVYAHLGGAS